MFRYGCICPEKTQEKVGTKKEMCKNNELEMNVRNIERKYFSLKFSVGYSITIILACRH